MFDHRMTSSPLNSKSHVDDVGMAVFELRCPADAVRDVDPDHVGVDDDEAKH